MTSKKTTCKAAESLGHMNKRIILRDESRTVGAGGRPVMTYPIIETIWAAISSRYHAPVVRGDKLEYPTTINFITHNVPLFRTAKRIEWQDRTFLILGFADPDGDDRFIEIRTREIK